MTEEVTNENVEAVEASEEQAANNINIGLEQMLAAILASKGAISITIPELIANYTDKQIAINQKDDGTIVFELVDMQTEEKEETND
jgi:hypothetical protein